MTVTHLKIVLVHGTWGRGIFRKKEVADWCNSKSAFVTRLAEAIRNELPQTTVVMCPPLNWSGKNSIFARERAARDLADVLRHQIADGHPVLIVAHSHGGNVALKAISLVENTSKIYLCTLATPFLSVFEVSRSPAHSREFMSVTGFLLSAAATYYLVPYSLFDSYFPAFGALVLAWYAFTNGIKLIRILLESLLINPPAQPGHTPTEWEQRPKRLADATAANPQLINGRLLVLRGVDDEASLSLATGAVLNRLTRSIYNAIASLLFGPLSLVAIIATALAIVVLGQSTKHYGWAILFVPLSILWASGLTSLFLLSLARGVFGWEMSRGAMRCDVLFDSVPDLDDVKVRTVGVGSQTPGLVHSLHELEEVPLAIADWLRRMLSSMHRL
jgi:hypothetical protein